ncbi:MAG: SUMF1/EgtB/PvdO family nonheme iron enzyme [Chloroflexi bacterium]|nr:SUMF1/EgtB/PvdO family nonheme iron enzyme [Chloroflexota bacterium]
MTDPSLLQPEQPAGTAPNLPSLATTLSGGVDFSAERITVGGDVVGRDKIVQGYTAGEVRALLEQIAVTLQPKPFTGQCPYVGLRPFDEGDADLFFGRETSIANLTTRLNTTRALFITGPSGSGKSSLARAGLIAGLKRGALPGSDRWLYETLKPGREPMTELARVASSLAGTLRAGEDIRTKGGADASQLAQWIEVVLKDDRARRAVILIDQFEETFTQVADESERAVFLNLLTHAATVDGGRITLVLAMRSDFVSNCAAYPHLNALLNQQFWQLGAMAPDELVNAIAQPALRVGLKIEPALIAQIIADMKSEPRSLPLVQFALHDLFEARSAAGGVMALTQQDYLAHGGIHKALERHADSSFARLNEVEQSIAREIFGGLVQIGRGADDTRRTALVDELVPTGIDPAQVVAVVGKLADARLIITDEHAGRDSVTLAHEKLIDAWPWLHQLVDQRREALNVQNRIAQDAQDWLRLEHDTGLLYRGAKLEQALNWQARYPDLVHGPSRAFLTASVDEQARERQRERNRQQARRLTVGLSALAVLLIFGLIQPPLDREVRRQRALAMDTLKSVEPLALQVDAGPVTNRQYRWCVQAAHCIAPAPQFSTYAAAGDDNDHRPVTGLDALQAARYCEWLGRRLPTIKDWQALLPWITAHATAGIQLPAEDTFEWTASSFPKQETWDGSLERLPAQLILVDATPSRIQSPDINASPSFRDVHTSFRCMQSAK